MFAPLRHLGQDERFPNRLPADLFQEAVLRLKAGQNAVAPGVIVINASLGDRNKPFTGRMSGRARVIDYLSYTYGLLFVISAGNHLDDLITADMNTVSFEALDSAQKAKVALRASAAVVAQLGGILAPAEIYERGNCGAPCTATVSRRVPCQLTGYSTFGSIPGSAPRVGLAPVQATRLSRTFSRPVAVTTCNCLPSGARSPMLRPITKEFQPDGRYRRCEPPRQPTAASPDYTGRTVGTSVTAAITTGACWLELTRRWKSAYDDFLSIAGLGACGAFKGIACTLRTLDAGAGTHR